MDSKNMNECIKNLLMGAGAIFFIATALAAFFNGYYNAKEYGLSQFKQSTGMFIIAMVGGLAAWVTWP